MLLWKEYKKTWTSFVYVSQVSPNTQHTYTSKSPRRGVSICTFTLDCFFNWRFGKQEAKRRPQL